MDIRFTVYKGRDLYIWRFLSMKKFVCFFISTFMICCIASMALVYYIDPFYVFHMPFGGLQPIRGSVHYVARGLIRNMDYEILVCGSSMCENIHTDYVDDLYGSKSIKVVQHGSHSMDLEASLKVAAKTGKAGIIIMALDGSMWNKPADSYRVNNIPQYAVNESPFLYSIPYLINGSSFMKCMNLIQKNAEGKTPPMNNWWCMGKHSKEAVYVAYLKQKQQQKTFYDKDLARENLENLKKGIEVCQKKGIEIDFFIPPYSVAYFAFSDYRYQFEDYKELWKELLQYDNVHIYAVQFDTELISDLDNYRNLNHYNGDVSDTIINDIYYGKYELSMDNIDLETENFIEWLEEYDWSGLDKEAESN